MCVKMVKKCYKKWWMQNIQIWDNRVINVRQSGKYTKLSVRYEIMSSKIGLK